MGLLLFMFDQELYPTPESVIDQMGIDCYGKVVLEPSAGSGNIVDWLKKNGAREVIACEHNEKLRRILSGHCNIIANDFLTVRSEDVSHIQMIVMNPPFSNGAKHILHAWAIAPEGCELIALCNWETVAKDHYAKSRELSSIIADYGESMNMGACFVDSERSTNVEIGLVRLFKPVISSNMDMDGFYLTPDGDEPQAAGIMGFNEIRAVVNSYVAAVKCFDKVKQVADEMKSYTNVTIIDGQDQPHTLNFGHGLAFQAVHNQNGITDKATFAKAYQKVCWRYIFDRVGIEKYVTTGVLKKVNNFVEARQNYPFTVRNIGRMFDIIIGTREQNMYDAIVQSVDEFTRYTDENRYNVEGWKTNFGHLLGRKFITGWIAENQDGGTVSIRWHQGNWDKILDLTKALCYVTGISFDMIPEIREVPCDRFENGEVNKGSKYNRFDKNVWYDWGFFQFKLFKKGTGHFKFNNEDDWAMLNRAYAKAKGLVLPEKI